VKLFLNMEIKKLTAIDTLPDFEQNEPQLRLEGRVFQKDEKTPAKNVILYIYHTNREGLYSKRPDATGWAKRHGYIRGWIKTDHTGFYTFYTFRPAAYPNGREPEHIHVTVKEPDKNEYYIDDFTFSDDPMLSTEERSSQRSAAQRRPRQTREDFARTLPRIFRAGYSESD